MITVYSGTQVPIETPSDFSPGGFVNIVTFNLTDLVHVPEDGFSGFQEAIIINPRFDIAATQSGVAAGAKGAIVVEWGTDINNANSQVVLYDSERIFPVIVEGSILFPGDKPRGTPLN